MKTASHAQTTSNHGSWPFPAAGHFRKTTAAASAPGGHEDEDNNQDDKVDPAEQELVQEQKERDRQAAHAVDPAKKARSEP